MRLRLVFHGALVPVVACGALLPTSEDPPAPSTGAEVDGGRQRVDAAGSSHPTDAGMDSSPPATECVEPGKLCVDAGLYCTADLRCVPCAGEGERCADTTACCGVGECRPGPAGSVCEREQTLCPSAGVACSANVPCCAGTRCNEAGECVRCLPVSACTNDFQQCCSGAVTFRPSGNCAGMRACQ